MDYIAKWGPKGFYVQPYKIVTLTGLSTSLTLKDDSESDTSGTSQSNTRGRELRPVSFSVDYLRAAGTDPRAQLEEWESLLGQKYPLYIGGKLFGPQNMVLKGVDSSIILSDKGAFLGVTVNITLEEDSVTKKAADKKSNTSSKSKTKEEKKTLSSQLTASDYDKLVKKPTEIVQDSLKKISSLFGGAT